MGHQFHIPVLGLAFSIDTPIKVARYGISSVISIVDDELIERVREYYSQQFGKAFQAITKAAQDYRAKRITAYLNLVLDIVNEQIHTLKNSSFEQETELSRYFELLPEHSVAKQKYILMGECKQPDIKASLQRELKRMIRVGDIDVNIMSKVDKINADARGNQLDETFSDALSALRGFAESNLRSSVVLSAGMNPRLYHYLSGLKQFHPHPDGTFEKKVILKVSDYRSAQIQAKFLAKKGIWISEFRIESGLNCGGHAFATDGYLLGPILEEFKTNKEGLKKELAIIYRQALAEKGWELKKTPSIAFTVQGGIGTATEQQFLLDYYEFDRTGWGSPFLLVPEATTVDEETLQAMAHATASDFYVSGASPLGVPFNNFRHSSAEKQRLERIAKGRPGSPCTKKYLISNQEFTEAPICTASREYQHRKLKSLDEQRLSDEEYSKKVNEITEKTCLCQGLASAAYIKYGIQKKKENTVVAICPGPNLAYFDASYSLQQMIDHIYGRRDLLSHIERPLLFVNELNLYIEYIKKYVDNNWKDVNEKKVKYVEKFKHQLFEGISYYESLKSDLSNMFSTISIEALASQLVQAKKQLNDIYFSQIEVHTPIRS